MGRKDADDKLTDAEIAERLDRTIRRMLTTPHSRTSQPARKKSVSPARAAAGRAALILDLA